MKKFYGIGGYVRKAVYLGVVATMVYFSGCKGEESKPNIPVKQSKPQEKAYNLKKQYNTKKSGKKDDEDLKVHEKALDEADKMIKSLDDFIKKEEKWIKDIKERHK